MSAESWTEGASAVVSLTYDGSLPSHLRRIRPILNDCGIRATFYAYPPNVLERLGEWREAVDEGHELGNHTFFGAADQDGLLPEMSPEGAFEEMEDCRSLLEGMGSTVHSFAYPSVRTATGDAGLPIVPEIVHDSIVRINELMLSDSVSDLYQIARSPTDGHNLPGQVDPLKLRSFVADGLDLDSLTVLAQVGISQQSWTILVFNASEGAEIDLVEHERFCRWLASRTEEVSIRPVVEVGRTLLKVEGVY